MQTVVDIPVPVQNADDYAFIVRYDPTRLLKQLLQLHGAVRVQMIGLVVSVVVAVMIWRSNDTGSVFRPYTVTMMIVIGAGLVVQVIAMFVAKSEEPDQARSMAAMVLTYFAAGTLFYPVVAFLFPLAADLRLFAQLPGVELFMDVTWVYPVLIAGVIVAGVLFSTAAILMVLWRVGVTPGCGYTPRSFATAAMMTCGGISLLGGIMAVVMEQSIDRALDEVLEKIPAGIDTSALDSLTGDGYIWMVAAMLSMVGIRMGMTTLKMASLSALAIDMPYGPALRIDAAGIAVADPKTPGPDRIAWSEVGITARGHMQAPGPELVIQRPQALSWSVPFLYLDVLPGTIDSAIRSATLDARSLDLQKLDRVI